MFPSDQRVLPSIAWSVLSWAPCFGASSLHPISSQLEAPCAGGGWRQEQRESSCRGFSRSCRAEGQYLLSSWSGAVHHCLRPLTFQPSHPYLRNVFPSTWGTTPDLGRGLLSSLLHSQAGNWPQGRMPQSGPSNQGGGQWNLGRVPPGFPLTSEL